MTAKKTVSNLLKNFKGEILPPPTNLYNPENKGIIGQMSEDVKKIHTLYIRTLAEHGEIIEGCDYKNPFLEASQYYGQMIIKHFQQSGDVYFETKKDALALLSKSKALYKVLESMIYEEFPDYTDHNLTFDSEWQILDCGKKKPQKTMFRKMKVAIMYHTTRLQRRIR